MKLSLLLLSILCCSFALGQQNQRPDSFYLSGTVRDFWPCQPVAYVSSCEGGNCVCHPDFEPVVQVSEDNLVLSAIDTTTRLPQLNPAKSSQTISSSQSFSSWFRDVSGTNIAIPYTLLLENPGNSPYYWNSTNAFFPINGQGWGNYPDTGRNPHFTYELHAKFVYQGGEHLHFIGNDDVWIYINNNLVIDISGVHNSESQGEVLLNKLGLKKGTLYDFDLFYTNRHNEKSTFRLKTSINFSCAWKDHCNVCLGDGSSCCNCNDNNKCTVDTCQRDGTCVFTPTECTPSDKCKSASCNANNGKCEETPISCEDGNACTVDTCNPLSGCSRTALNCNDNNACTLDTCNPSSGCSHSQVQCNDNNPCTVDSCDTSAGCKFVPRNCDDNNKCTIDTCDLFGCKHESIGCDDDNECTEDSCNPNTGCTHFPKTCNDNNACTADSCDPEEGCTHDIIPCDDGISCTIDVCLADKGCQHIPMTCNDNSVCTADSCSNGECQFNPIPCDDNDPCTVSQCHPISGCAHTRKNCDDGLVCTIDSCDAGTGDCIHTQISECLCAELDCESSDPCKPKTCESGECVDAAEVDCDDSDPCTIDSCDGSSGVAVCNHELLCPTENLCSPAKCEVVGGEGVCSTTDVTCNDDNSCTVDSCNPSNGECEFETRDCSGVGNLCSPSYCDLEDGVCKTTTKSCDDKNPCTSDSCDLSSGNCVNEFKECDGSTLCSPLVCDPTTLNGDCVPSGQKDCNDDNSCTTDSCNNENGECVHTPIDCDDGNSCTIDGCNGGTCSHIDIECDDNNDCTTDYCEDGQCKHDPISCDDENACTVDTCEKEGGCSNSNIVCNDNNLCTNDICDPSVGCLFTPIEAPIDEENDFCSYTICDPQNGFITAPVECRPSDNCKCVSGEGCKCVFSLLVAEGGSKEAMSAGGVAAISIGVAAVVFFAALGSKKGLDFWRRKDLMTGTVVSSDLYESRHYNVENALYEA